MSPLRFLPLVVLLSVSLPAVAATHTWLGTVSSTLSDPANWSLAQPPTGDPDAKIVFSRTAVRTQVVNDIAGLRVEDMVFEAGFELSGAPLTVGTGTITAYDSPTVVRCDIAIGGTLFLGGGQFDGTLSGPGGVVIRGPVDFGGSTPNSYSGETSIESGGLRLEKSAGTLAVAGDVVVGPGTGLAAETAEQIAATATIDLRAGALFAPNAAQTIARLLCADRAQAGYAGAQEPLTVHELVVNGQAIEVARLRLTNPVLDVREGRSIRLTDTLVPEAGLTIRGAGSFSWSGGLGAKVIVDGAIASFDASMADVVLKAGSVTGQARSLTASGGRVVELFESTTDFRLGPGVTLIADAARHAGFKLNGTFDPGGATLVVGHGLLYAGTFVAVSNASELPAAGTFAGAPENGTISNGYALSYQGGNGNDVALRRLDKLLPWLTLEASPDPPLIGTPVTFSATMPGSAEVPTGSVTFTDLDGRMLGVAPLNGGKASITFTPGPELQRVHAVYSGDALYGPSEDWFVRPAQHRAPVITTIDPSSVPRGIGTTVTVRGEHFRPGMAVSIAPYTLVRKTTFVSPTELRATFDLRRMPQAVPEVTVVVTSDSGSSNAMPFPVTAADPNAAISFDAESIVGRVEKGAKAVWITSGDRRPEAIVDSDEDGVVAWPWSAAPYEHYGIVDLRSGRSTIYVRNGGTPAPFPDNAFSEGALLTLPANDSLRYSVLWVRPGTGVWGTTVEDGDDADGLRNFELTISASDLPPLDGKTPAPDAFAAGDLVIAMSSADGAVYAQRLAGNFLSAAPGRLAAFGADRAISENAGLVRLPVVRTNGSSGTVSVRYATSPVTAIPGVHYTHTAGTLTFAPTQTVQWIEVPVFDDDVWGGGARTFRVSLSDPEGTTLGSGTVFAVTIADDENRPVIAYAGPAERSVPERDAPYSISLDLELTGATSVPATVEWFTAGAVVARGRVTFAPGERAKSIPITIPGDNVLRTEEARIAVVLEGDGAQIAHRFASIQVIEDDQRLVSADADVFFHDETAREAYVLLTAPQTPPAISLSYEIESGTATAGSDFTAVAGSVTFDAVHIHKAILVPLVNDSELEGDETLTVKLRPEKDAAIARDTVTIVIVDDELTQRPNVSVGDTTIVEGDEGVALAAFPVTLSAASSYPVTIYYEAVGGTAVEGADFEASRGSIAVAPGQTAATIFIPVRGDPADEADEAFTVRLIGTMNAQLGSGDDAQGLIVDDDVPVTKRRAMRR